MKEIMRERLKELTSIIGLSGYEWDVARYIKKELESHVDICVKFREEVEALGIRTGSQIVLDSPCMAIVSLAIPRRYSHSPVEVCNLNDVVATLKITEDFLKKRIDLTMI